MSIKVFGVSILAALIAGALLYRQFAGPVEVTKEVIKDRIITVTHTVTAPDGTVTTDTNSTETKKETISAKTMPRQLDWAAGLAYNTKREVSADLARRVLGPVFIVIGADQTGTFSLGLRAEF